jgi:hypothetical protein
VPLALLLGYLLTTPFSFGSYATVGLVLMVLAFPVLLRWHHPLLIFTWNAYFIVFFLPGQPALVFVMAACSFGISLLHHTLRREGTFFPVPSVSWSLIFLGFVILITARLTGGIGAHSLGQETWGAKRYLGVVGAIIGYFALAVQRVPRERAQLYARVFVLSGITAAISDLIYAIGPSFYFLFALFPAQLASSQAYTQDTFFRLSGVGFSAQSVAFFLMMRYGVRGLFDPGKPWRTLSFLVASLVSLLGGYRSALILGVLVFSVQFFYEGLLRTRLTLVFVLLFALLGSGLVAFSDRLPLSVQRSLSFLPVKVDPSTKLDAQSTLDWRLQIWKIVFPEIPKYLWVGKGFAYSGVDSYLTQEAIQRGMVAAYEETLISGNYHSGILTLIIPFGLWGTIGFVWFCLAGLKVLYRNYRSGDSHLRAINTFLLSLFVGRLIFYTIFYGQFDQDLMIFTGIVGLSIALNGASSRPDLEETQTAFSKSETADEVQAQRV